LKPREKAADKVTEDVGRLPTDNEVAVMVSDDRPEKLAELSTADVRREQRERLTPEGQEQLNDVWARAQESTDRPTPEFWSESSHSVQFAIDHTFARVSVSKDTTVL